MIDESSFASVPFGRRLISRLTCRVTRFDAGREKFIGFYRADGFVRTYVNGAYTRERKQRFAFFLGNDHDYSMRALSKKLDLLYDRKVDRGTYVLHLLELRYFGILIGSRA